MNKRIILAKGKYDARFAEQSFLDFQIVDARWAWSVVLCGQEFLCCTRVMLSSLTCFYMDYSKVNLV